MILRVGEMWDVYPTTDLFVFTSNSYVNRLGALVMGRGIASEVATRFPNLPQYFGQRIVSARLHLLTYGFLPPEMWWKTSGINPVGRPESKIGLFQVKRHWENDASLDLIQESTSRLKKWAEDRPTAKIDMNFPGIGYGRLRRAPVLEIVACLPDNITLWEKA